MVFLKGKIKVYVGIAIVILVLGIVQVFYLLNEEPPLLVEVTGKTAINGDHKVEEEGIQAIFIDIKGAINQPGVYEMDKESRITDVIAKAGGPTSEADLNQINLSMRVYDEMLIYIPKVGEELKQSLKAIYNGKISINQSGVVELMELEGIGEAKANAIIQYREANGSFKVLEDLMKVSGIGQKLFDQIKTKITIQ